MMEEEAEVILVVPNWPSISSKMEASCLSVDQSCLKFYNRRVTLQPNPAFQPKIIMAGLRSNVSELYTFCPSSFQSEEKERLHTLKKQTR